MRVLLFSLLAFTLLFAACSRGDELPRPDQGCLEGNCVSGTGRYSYPTGIFAGQFKEGTPHGEGVFTFSNGDRYDGFSINFKKENYGTYHYHTGERYVGQWKNDRREGYGVYYYARGDKYVGQWQGDVKNGEGVYHYLNGDRYEGSFSRDKPHGKGALYARDGTVKRGYWIYGAFAGDK